jgi:hypothetical protein
MWSRTHVRLFSLKKRETLLPLWRIWVRQRFTQANVFSLLHFKTYFFATFIFGNMAFLAFAFLYRPEKYADAMKKQAIMDQALDNFATKIGDGKRPPWPLLHLAATEMREGKRNLEELQKTWDQVKYYHNSDWLVPLEITQIMKFSTGRFLAQYVRDPETMRIELIEQLEMIRRGKVRTVDPITKEVQDIINSALDDLRSMSLANIDEIPLVPTHTK